MPQTGALAIRPNWQACPLDPAPNCLYSAGVNARNGETMDVSGSGSVSFLSIGGFSSTSGLSDASSAVLQPARHIVIAARSRADLNKKC